MQSLIRTKTSIYTVKISGGAKFPKRSVLRGGCFSLIRKTVVKDEIDGRYRTKLSWSAVSGIKRISSCLKRTVKLTRNAHIAAVLSSFMRSVFSSALNRVPKTVSRKTSVAMIMPIANLPGMTIAIAQVAVI